jgi:aryl-alcohol dehydrogenase-like predicted oxidoreductase
MQMKKRKLGGQGLEVPAIGLGCMAMPGFYRPGDEELSINTLRQAADIGINHIDASDLYGAASGTRYPAGGMKWLKL